VTRKSQGAVFKPIAPLNPTLIPDPEQFEQLMKPIPEEAFYAEMGALYRQ
jgi:hypothetical protein